MRRERPSNETDDFDVSAVVHCRYCFIPLRYVYCTSKRDLCHDCTEEIKARKEECQTFKKMKKT